MNKHILLALSIFLSTGFLTSCYYDKEELLYNTGPGNCDTMAVVTYSGHVLPLFQQYCYNCHGGTNPSGNIQMGTHTADSSLAMSGVLFASISHASGVSPMPDEQPKLQQCKINIIKRWIDAGSPDN